MTGFESDEQDRGLSKGRTSHRRQRQRRWARRRKSILAVGLPLLGVALATAYGIRVDAWDRLFALNTPLIYVTESGATKPATPATEVAKGKSARPAPDQTADAAASQLASLSPAAGLAGGGSAGPAPAALQGSGEPRASGASFGGETRLASLDLPRQGVSGGAAGSGSTGAMGGASGGSSGASLNGSSDGSGGGSGGTGGGNAAGNPRTAAQTPGGNAPAGDNGNGGGTGGTPAGGTQPANNDAGNGGNGGGNPAQTANYTPPTGNDGGPAGGPEGGNGGANSTPVGDNTPPAGNTNPPVGGPVVGNSGGTPGQSYPPAAGNPPAVGAGTPPVQLAMACSVLNGTDTIQGNLVISGCDVHSPGHSPGQQSVTGDYTLDGLLNIELAGTTPGTEYDQVDVTGTAYLNGTIQVSLLYGFIPQIDDVFDIILARDIVLGDAFQILFPDLGNGYYLDYLITQLADGRWALRIIDPATSPVPTPAALSLFVVGLAGLAALRRRRSTAAA